MAIATDIISPAINEVKTRFFPVRKNYWLKVGLVSLISSSFGAGSKNSINFNMPNPLNTINFPISAAVDFIKKHFIALIGLGGILFFFGIIYNIIKHIFSFIMVDSVISGKCEIISYFNKHTKKGFSAFLFWFLITLGNIIFFGLLLLPLIIPLIGNIGSLSPGLILSLINVPYLIFFIFVLVLDIIVFLVLGFIYSNFVIIDMYLKNINAPESFWRMLRLVKKEIFEVFIFLILKIALSIAAGIALFIIIIAFLIILGIIFFIALLLGLAIYKLGIALLVAYIIIAGLIGIALIILWLYAFAVLTSPVPSFFIMYAYLFLTEINKRNKDLFIKKTNAYKTIQNVTQ